MVKRLMDIFLALILLALTAPLLALALIAVFWQDWQWPLYSPVRIGKGGVPFHMHKLRSMVVGADNNKIDTTALHDPRITALGHALRRCKLDELPQLWNILRGEMSFVGPRPQIGREVQLYTEVEKGLLQARPGITDFSSIVFADLGQIMASQPDPNIAYNQLVRPWKSRLGLFYIAHASFWLDLELMKLTAIAIISKPLSRRGVVWLLQRLGAPPDLVDVCRRNRPLTPAAPPGATEIVTARNL